MLGRQRIGGHGMEADAVIQEQVEAMLAVTLSSGSYST
jgi:hypothetical protein